MATWTRGWCRWIARCAAVGLLLQGCSGSTPTANEAEATASHDSAGSDSSAADGHDAGGGADVTDATGLTDATGVTDATGLIDVTSSTDATGPHDAETTAGGDGDAAADTGAAAPLCGGWGAPEKAAKLPTPIDEASGLAVSSFDADVLWTHNDGKEGRLYAVRASTGARLATVQLTGLTDSQRDWEDLAAGPCGSQAPGKRCLYIADTGDNGKSRKVVHIHRVIEPNPNQAPSTIGAYQTLALTYPDKPHDSEALAVEESGRVWLFTKSSTKLSVFSAPFIAGAATLKAETTFDRAKQMGGDASRVTGADWHPVAHTLILRTHDTAWEVCPGAAGLAALSGAPWHQVKVADEVQGEAIAYGTDTIWQVSEGASALLRKLPRL